MHIDVAETMYTLTLLAQAVFKSLAKTCAIPSTDIHQDGYQ